MCTNKPAKVCLCGAELKVSRWMVLYVSYTVLSYSQRNCGFTASNEQNLPNAGTKLNESVSGLISDAFFAPLVLVIFNGYPVSSAFPNSGYWSKYTAVAKRRL